MFRKYIICLYKNISHFLKKTQEKVRLYNCTSLFFLIKKKLIIIYKKNDGVIGIRLETNQGWEKNLMVLTIFLNQYRKPFFANVCI